MSGQETLFETGTPRPWCTQCGRPFSEPACGVTHAAIAAEQAVAAAPKSVGTTTAAPADVHAYSAERGDQERAETHASNVVPNERHLGRREDCHKCNT